MDASLNTPGATPDLEELRADISRLRDEIIEEAAPLLERFGASETDGDTSLVNLAHYLCLRHRDLRPLQRRLMRWGLSSLGRLESRVLPTLDAVLTTLDILAGHRPTEAKPYSPDFFAGENRLTVAANRLFGPPPTHRRNRIMVTLPSEAATDADLVSDLVQRGMNIARINCAHDDASAWRAMTAHVQAAGEAHGCSVKILMDIAGPKIRTGEVSKGKHGKRLQAGDTFRLVSSVHSKWSADGLVTAGVSLPQMVGRLASGNRLLYDDGKLEGRVEDVGTGEAIIRVDRTKHGGTKLKPEKGINLPDTALGLSPLTAKDEEDLTTVIECADMLGYSFVSQPDDIDLLEEVLASLGKHDGCPTLGLVAKIELPEAVHNLPDLIARASSRRPFGVMIARGDLAAEIGFERLAEMQEEILWVCEAASTPVIWATQVLENLVKTGSPSRGEMTDAAMSARAECVMLNKGPSIGDGVTVLDSLLTRMDGHVYKKTPTLRALKSW